MTKRSTFMTVLAMSTATTALVLSGWGSTGVAQPESQPPRICSGESDFEKRRLDSEQVDRLCETFKGKVVLVVNTASRCGFTYQYDGLEKLYAERKGEGLMVVGFPSNDFANQEPGTESEIKSFCRLTYGVQFPMYEKTHVRGNKADPFYQTLAQLSGDTPQWNFHKYLIDRDGYLVGSFPSQVKPNSEALVQAINQAL